MKLDELYKFIGYGVVSFFILYIVVKSIRFQLGIVEGLTNNLRGKKPAATEQRPTKAEQEQGQAEQTQAEQEAEQDSDSEQEQED